MLIRLIEDLLINTFNRAADRRAQRRESPEEPFPEIPEDYTVLGRIIPGAEQPTSAQQTERRLTEAGLVALSPEARMRHLYLLGATGTGKTNLLMRLIESDIRNRRAFCVIDLRGDLVDRILTRLAHAAPPESWRDRLVLIDLRDQRHAVGFNPLQGEGDAYNRALHLLAILKHQSDSWGVQLEETLRNALLALAETGWTLLEIEPLLTVKPFRAEVMRQVRDARVRSFFERYDALSAANQTTWALAVLNKVTPLLSIPALRLTFGQQRTVGFRALFDRQPGSIVLAALAADRLHEAAQLAGGLLVSSFQTAMMSRADVPESQRLPVHLYVDEFESMASDRFEAIVAEGRRFGLGLTLSHQNLNQLPSNLRHVVRNNVHTQVFFQTGALDAAELTREIGGREPDVVRSTLMSQGVGQAFLVRRGQPSVRVQVEHSPDPAVAASALASLRRVAMESHGRSAAEVAAELDLRDAHWRGGSLRDESAAERPTYEIRHSRSANFKPKKSGDLGDAGEEAVQPEENTSEPEVESPQPPKRRTAKKASAPVSPDVTERPKKPKSPRTKAKAKEPAKARTTKAPRGAAKAKASEQRPLPDPEVDGGLEP